MKRKSNKIRKISLQSALVRLENDVRKQNLIQCGELVVYTETVTYVYEELTETALSSGIRRLRLACNVK